MRTRTVTFSSDGIELTGGVFEPDAGVEASAPLLFFNSGFMGLRTIHPERFARALTPRGFSCFGFDYRGFGPSGGTPGAVLLDDQVRDIIHAVHFLRASGELDGRKLVLAGWGMAGGLIVRAARQLLSDDLLGLVAINGFYDALRVQREVRGPDGWRQFCVWLTAMRDQQAADGATIWCDPFDIYPLDPVTQDYVDGVLRKNPDFGGRVHLAFAASLLDMSVGERFDPAFVDVPLLVAHGDRNTLHPVTEADALAHAYPGPCSTYWIEGGGHTEWMFDDHPLFLALVERLDAWVRNVNAG